MNGPLTAEMLVADDFYSYKNGTMGQSYPEPEKEYTNDLLTVNTTTSI